MLSFSLDENGNQSFFKDAPEYCSTPKKTRQKLTCQYCSKSYVSQHYFTLHVKSHLNQVSTSAGDSSRAVHLDVSDISFSRLGEETTNNNTFKVPGPVTKRKAVPKGVKPKKKPHLICTYCLRGYVCSRSFKTHLRTHILQDASARFPDTADILKNAGDISLAALTHVANSPSVGRKGQSFKALVGHVVSESTSDNWKKFSHDFCEELLKCIENQKCLLPSALLNTLMEHLEDVISNFDLRDKFLGLLEVTDKFAIDLLDQFCLEFCLNLSTEIFQFICKTFRERLPRRRQQQLEAVIDKEEKQVVYYIAGSIMRGYLKIARRFKNSTWESVASAIRSKILVDKPVGDIDAEWTEDVDRGSLLYVSPECQTFFVNLTKVVYASEKKDGSIDYESVISKVSTSDLSVQWDTIVLDSLPENVSINMMNDVIKCFCKTCGRGFAKRRLNSIRSKPVISMPTRHSVATRNKK